MLVSDLLKKLCKEDGTLSSTLGEIVKQFGTQGFGLLLFILSLPSALPLPAPGYSTPFGILIIVIGIQLLIGRKTPWYPNRYENKKIFLPKKLVNLAYRMLKLLEIFVRTDRCKYLFVLFNKYVLGLNIIILAFIMALPIPLTNTLPAAIILLFGISLLCNDGLFLLFAQICSLIAISAYVTATYILCTFGIEKLRGLCGL